MGCIHHWCIVGTTKWLEIWPQLVADAQHIVDEAKVPLSYYGGSGEDTDPAIIDIADGIHLNGSEKSHETFMLGPESRREPTFCKTARKPYDLVATAILLRAWQLAGKAIQLGTDGSWNDEWKEAHGLLMKLWPDDDETANPFSEGESNAE